MTEGVRIPMGQRRANERTEPNKILAIMPVQQYIVKFSDGAGLVHDECWYDAGGVLYQPPNTEDFTMKLRPIKDVLVKQARTALTNIAKKSGMAKAADPVDVVSAKIAKSIGKNEVDV